LLINPIKILDYCAVGPTLTGRKVKEGWTFRPVNIAVMGGCDGTMPAPWPLTPPTLADRAAYADAEPRAFWLADLPTREPCPPLHGPAEADLCIVGGGFTGLWAALQAKAEDPGRDVVLLEAGTIGCGASGRNGGFLIGSLTHGLENGLARFGDEIELLERLGRENLTGLVADLERLEIDCDLEMTGELTPSVAAYQDGWAAETAELYGRFGYDVEVFPDAAAMRAEVDSPLYRGGAWVKDAGGVLDPAKLAVGLFEAARRVGVRVHEGTPVMSIEDSGRGAGSRPPGGSATATHDAPVVVRTPAGTLTARRVLVGTSAYPSPVREIRRYIAPVYDYALMSEPLDPAQKEALGWDRRQGIGDGGNRFHYYRLSADDRILWGGFDAVYRYGGPVRPDLDDHDATLRPPRPELPRHLPPARRPALHPSLGRGDRHLQPLLGLLRDDTRRPGRLRDRLHRPRRGGDPLRRPGRPRPARRPRYRGDPQPLRPPQAAPLPARAAP
jgi:glycine/D-amino acid oxidase-like deaminating enzyme